MPDLSSRVTIIAVGVNRYQDSNLDNLRGAHQDIEKLKSVLTKDKKTALYQSKQFVELRDPDSKTLKEAINKYIIDRSAGQDILILYFSGHGVAIGRDDFGFCTTDTVVNPNSGVVLPISVVKFSEVLDSLNTANVVPIFIIDACYSGIIGKGSKLPAIASIAAMQNKAHTVAASSFALLCSCSELEASLDTKGGGVFSNQLVATLKEGIDNNSSTLTLSDIYLELYERVLSSNVDTVPRLYIGPTIPKFPLSLNPKYKAEVISLSPFYISILKALWNDGKEKHLSPDEISRLGKGAYGNRNKLRLEPWSLTESMPNTNKHRLTKRGKEFMQNKVKVPKKIAKDPKSKKWIALKDAELVNYSFFLKKKKKRNSG